jgi:hypothetical protein
LKGTGPRQTNIVRLPKLNLRAHGLWVSVAFALGVCLTGCSSRAYVIARQNAQYQLSPANKLAVADHAHPAPEEQSLRTALMTELRQKGFNLVPASEAEYTLTYWIDVSWKRGKIVVPSDYSSSSWRGGYLTIPGQYNPSAPPRITPQVRPDSQSALSIQHVVEVPWETKGIRLKVFPQQSMRAGDLRTAWDGYIEVGKKVSEAREPALVRTLLTYFGTDFVGRARLETTPESTR